MLGKGWCPTVLSKEEITELLKPVQDPFLHKTLEETDGIKGISIKEEKKHVSVKIGIAKTNTAEQMNLQQEIVGILKKNGASTVGLRFEQLTDEVIQQFYTYDEEEHSKTHTGVRMYH